MDALSAVLLGALAGLVTGLVPGLHVNTLAALMLATVPLGGDGVLFLVSVGTVHTLVNILPATYLGIPDEDDALSVLPAHRLLLAGEGPTAVRVSVLASLTALLAAVAMGSLYGWLLLGSPGLLGSLDAVLPWVVATTLLVLWHQSGWALWALATQVASGALGLLAMELTLRPLVAVPATPLLPLLAGLFGAPTLLLALRRPPRVPPQLTAARIGPPRGAVASGVLASAATAVLPGLTAAVATSLVPRGRRSDDPVGAIAALSAVSTAHAVLALQVFFLTGRVRSGLAQATASAAGPEDVSRVLLAVLVAGLLGGIGTLGLDRFWSGNAARLPGRALSAGALAVTAGLVVVLSGGTGVLLFATAATLGLVPITAGVRRVHLVAALLVPVLLRSLG